jgi:hypothetical protein
VTPYESLMLETIPVRITRAPKADQGPTEQLRIREAQQALWAMAAEPEPDEAVA